MRALALVLFVSLWLGLSAPVQAQTQTQTALPVQPSEPALMAENGVRLSLNQAQQARDNGAFKADLRGSLGLNAPPQWMVIDVPNPSAQPLSMHFRIGMSWLDQVDVHVVNSAGVSHQRLGDDLAGAIGVVPGVGIVVPVVLQPGSNSLWVRVETPDPLLLTPQLLTPDGMARLQRATSYGYGMLYGYIAALAIFFALLWLGLGVHSNSGYSVYLLSFVALNVGYTGHGWALLWSDWVGLQHYVNLLLMTVFGAASLVFGVRYLGLAVSHPRFSRWVMVGASLGLVTVPLMALVDSQAWAVRLAFTFTFVATSFPVVLGTVVVMEARGRDVSANYYLAAILWGLGGAGITTMTTWGLLPFSNLGFHALEFGVAAEATLLALGLNNQIRERERGRLQATSQARTDPLTGLPNRLAFEERAAKAWGLSVRHGRPLCALVLDVDNFKTINDERGHAAGDQCLRWLAEQILVCCRATDIPVRWGGDEFVVLMPETDVSQAVQMAERLRLLAAGGDVSQGGMLSISVGVAGRQDAVDSLVALVEVADQALLTAKRAGRNRVVLAPVPSAATSMRA